MRATNIDWRKRFQWALEVETPTGVANIAQILKCKFPEVENESSEIKQAGALHSLKQPGMLKYGDIEFERVLLSTGPDTQMHDWLTLAANPETGRGLRPSMVKKTVDLLHLNEDGVAIERVRVFGAWVKKVDGDGQEGSSEAWIEKITLSCDYFTRRAA